MSVMRCVSLSVVSEVSTIHCSVHVAPEAGRKAHRSANVPPSACCADPLWYTLSFDSVYSALAGQC